MKTTTVKPALSPEYAAARDAMYDAYDEALEELHSPNDELSAREQAELSVIAVSKLLEKHTTADQAITLLCIEVYANQEWLDLNMADWNEWTETVLGPLGAKARSILRNTIPRLMYLRQHPILLPDGTKITDAPFHNGHAAALQEIAPALAKIDPTNPDDRPIFEKVIVTAVTDSKSKLREMLRAEGHRGIQQEPILCDVTSRPLVDQATQEVSQVETFTITCRTAEDATWIRRRLAPRLKEIKQ